jgi:catechol 2,3-dioxygenase-like lactoylglutathione lyase family enzyme
MNERRIAEIVLRSPDPELTLAFYVAAFGATPDGPHAFTIGAQRVRLQPTEQRVTRLAPGPATSFQHFAIVTSDMSAAFAHLETIPGWTSISTFGPQRLPATSGGVTAFKFRDLDGHPLELLAFPRETCPATWRETQGLFLGIDHTAISVRDTQESSAFWGQYGFKPQAQSLNQGVEQGRLDGLDSPLVEVTSLACSSSPPHLELLCYRQPAAYDDRRQPSDILATTIVLAGGDVLASGDALAGGDAIKAAVDPDGHRIVQS